MRMILLMAIMLAPLFQGLMICLPLELKTTVAYLFLGGF